MPGSPVDLHTTAFVAIADVVERLAEILPGIRGTKLGYFVREARCLTRQLGIVRHRNDDRHGISPPRELNRLTGLRFVDEASETITGSRNRVSLRHVVIMAM
jgi:hypothetical protein